MGKKAAVEPPSEEGYFKVHIILVSSAGKSEVIVDLEHDGETRHTLWSPLYEMCQTVLLKNVIWAWS